MGLAPCCVSPYYEYMEEDDNEIVDEDTKDFKGATAGGLIGLAICLFVSSSMTLLTSLALVWFWALVSLVAIPLGWWLGRFLPRVSGLSVVLLVALCLVALFGPIHIQRARIGRIVNQVLELPHLEIKRLWVSLTGFDGPPGFHLKFTTKTDAREVIEFYRNTLTARGWEILDVSFRDVESRATKFRAYAAFEIPGKYNLSISASDARWKVYEPNTISCRLVAWNWSFKA